MLFRKKRNQPEVTYPYGYLAAEQPTTKLSNRGIICLIRGLIIYAAALGTIGAVITSFSLPCHYTVIAVGLFVFAMALSFVHYNKWIFYFSYPAIFFLFVTFIVLFRRQVNSGYQAFMSILQEEYSTYFDLTILRQAQEIITDRTQTITYASLFIGFFLLLLLNIAVSEYMSLVSVILMTFPIFQLGIYIDLMPGMPSTILLIASYFMIGILKRSEHFLLPYHNKKCTEFRFKEKNNISSHIYHASGRMMYQLAGLFCLFTLVIMILSLPLLLHTNASAKKSTLRTVADKYVANFTQSGLSSFFNRYQAKGGISEGKLGGVSAVRPDYQTDLTITFVPYAYETLYLKAFTGGDYSGDRWEEPTFDETSIQKELDDKFFAYSSYTGFLEANRLKLYTDTHNHAGIYAKMKVENVDANTDYLYLPYYTTSEISAEYSTSKSIVRGRCETGSSYTLSYYPLLHDYWQIVQSPDAIKEYYGDNHIYSQYIAQYDNYCYENYRSVPASISSYLTSLHDTIGYAVTTDEQIVMIQNFLEKNYAYDMQPGTTPYRQDFVQYFLETQKKGYCAHFASAATLLLRSYDIPARYVEGYAVSFMDISEGTNLDESYEEWFVGDNPIGKSGVISVDVTDASAHAWVEVYKQGIGWVPYEFTPPSSDDDAIDYADFWSIFAALLPSGDAVSSDGTASEAANMKKRTFRRLESSFLMPFFLFMSSLLLTVLLVLLFRRILAIHRLDTAYRRGNYSPKLCYYYQRIVKQLLKLGWITTDVLLPGSLSDITARQSFSQTKETAKWPGEDEISLQMQRLEACCYSKNGITGQEADGLLLFLKRYLKLLKNVRSDRG